MGIKSSPGRQPTAVPGYSSTTPGAHLLRHLRSGAVAERRCRCLVGACRRGYRARASDVGRRECRGAGGRLWRGLRGDRAKRDLPLGGPGEVMAGACRVTRASFGAYVELSSASVDITYPLDYT